MLAKITLYDGTVYKIASQTVDTEDGIYLGRIKDELSLVSAMQEAGNAPETISLTIINYDNFIPHNKDLWAADVLLTNDNNISWRGKINFCNFDSDGNLYVTASEKTAPELELQLPDEVRQVYTIDEDFHQSSVTMTIPLVIGGTTSNPITLPTILIDKTRGIYLICVGEIRSIVKVYNGAEQLPQAAYTAYTGTADQQENAGFAYVQIAEDYRLNSDGTYAEINVDVVGLKLGNHTEAECRNGARFLYYFLTTADTGINGWGCGIDSSLIDTTSFNSAITLCDQLGYKLDGIMWLRQSAQSWIDQICQAIHGKYSINANGKRSLFIDYAGNASKKTFTASNMQVDRYGKNSYTSVVYNKGVLSYDYNPITGLFMQSAQYENADSIAQIGEQKFIGESYLIKDATTALAVLEYTCKRSQIAAEAIEFDTDAVETNLRAGDIITINRPDLNLNNALYQIQSISTTDFQSSIIAVKFDTSVFSVTGTASTVNWGNERDITPALTPAQATNLLLSTGFDINPDGTGIPYISGTFTVPDGGWLAAAVQYGIGTNPSNWTELALITEGRFKISPVNVDTVYSIRVRMITATGHSSFITGVITATGDTIPPLKPTISAKATDRTVTIQCGLDTPPADMGGFQIYRKKSTDSESAYTYIGSIAANRGYAAFSDYVDEYVTYNYKAKSYDRSGNLSTQFSDVANVAITGVEAVSLAASAIAMPTGSILRLSAKNCTTASIAETNGVKDCSGRGNHGKGLNGVAVVQDNVLGDCFSFDGSNDYISLNKSSLTSLFNGLKGITIFSKFKINSGTLTNNVMCIIEGFFNSNRTAFTVRIYNKLLCAGGRRTQNDDYVEYSYNQIIEEDRIYAVAASFDYLNQTVKIYIDGECVVEANDFQTSGNLEITPQGIYLGITSSFNRGLNGLISDLRIYPRVLSNTEIKSVFMIPDETVFAQLTTDMFGANIIHANYILNDGDFQTLAVNAVNANINNLNVAGNATFTGLSNKVTAKYGTCSTGASTAAKVVDLDNFVLFTGARISVKFSETNSKANPTLNVEGTGAKTIRAKGANLTASSLYNWVAGDVVDFVYDGTYWVISDISAKDYSNTELAKKMSIASYCASSDTTKIDGANIYAGSVTATQMAANAITAEKLNVSAFQSFPNPFCRLNFNGATASSLLSSVPDVSGNGNNFIGLGTFSITRRNGKKAVYFQGGSSNASRMYRKMTFKHTYYTVLVDCEISDTSMNPSGYMNSIVAFGLVNNSSMQIRIGYQSGKLMVDKDGTTYNTGVTIELNKRYRIIMTVSGSYINVWVNGIIAWNSALSTGTVNGAIWIINGRSYQNETDVYCAPAMYLYDFGIWEYNVNADYQDSIYTDYLKRNEDETAGQITADRIATDAIKSRNFSGTTDGSAFSTYGSFLDLANGNFVTPFFRLRSNSSYKDCQIGNFTINSNGSLSANISSETGVQMSLSAGSSFKYQTTFYPSGISCYYYSSSSHLSNASGFGFTKISFTDYGTSSTNSESEMRSDYISLKYNGNSGALNEISPNSITVTNYNSDSGVNASYSYSMVRIYPATTSKYGLYVAGKARINTTDYGSDEKTKKDFQDVSTLDKLKKLRVCAWRFDEEKLVEKDNAFIDEENIKIEAENKTIDAENAEIEKENELRKNRKDGVEVELLPLKERKKLREHRIADKNANHPLNIGCMAGEFNKAFGTNNGSEDCLSVTDTIGVCMRAIQELAEIVDSQKAEIAELKALLKNSKDNDSEKELIEPSFDELLEDNENKK